jgi:NH3-dependent NAD+ synthetase
MKDTLEAKLAARDKELVIAKRERNALLTTLRELQKKQQLLSVSSGSSSSTSCTIAASQLEAIDQQQQQASATDTSGTDTVATSIEQLAAKVAVTAFDSDDQALVEQRDGQHAEHIAEALSHSSTSGGAIADAVLARRIADMTAKTAHLLSLDSDSSDDDE